MRFTSAIRFVTGDIMVSHKHECQSLIVNNIWLYADINATNSDMTCEMTTWQSMQTVPV